MNSSALVKEHERLDDLDRNGLMIIQDPARFCFGMDAVLLSSFARVKKGERVLDIGTGTGIIPLLLSAKTKAGSITGLDIQPELCDMARRSIALNGLERLITIDEGDVRELARLYTAGSFDVVTVNPPYTETGRGARGHMALERHEVACALTDVAAGAAKALRTGGRFYMVHRPERLADIITALRAHALEPKTLRFVHPHAGKEPSLMLIGAARGGRPSLKVAPPLFVYDENGRYTREMNDIYYG